MGAQDVVTIQQKISVTIFFYLKNLRMREFFYLLEFKRIIRRKAALLLIFYNSYRFTTMRWEFSNS